MESNLSENKKKVLLKVLDQHLEKIRVKQIDYLSEWEGKAYIGKYFCKRYATKIKTDKLMV